MNVRSKILKIRNLPTDGELIDHINAKPYLFILVCIAIGLALMFTRLYPVSYTHLDVYKRQATGLYAKSTVNE